MMAPAWTIVVTKPCAEEIAERSLRVAGYRVYLPRFRKLLLPHGRERQPALTMRPLFDRLLFVQDWRGWPAIGITGVASVMTRHRKGPPATLSDQDIGLMMAKERQGEFDDVKRAPGRDGVYRDDLEIGSEVEFEAFGTRMMGVLDELSPDGRAIVHAMLFNRETPFEVDAMTLSVVSA